ncbi:histone-fold-containing protein [Coniophora puteana RWD-64-598 SS2]|uniref:DNA polymerase epsilon subunit D n=1 Tax=Coniophora puteana (strain RWD-64-598) TaxID=741705 RepID=R7SEK0_CONPW|nr:histone-fold-containing protein [Coniophora puteana RWD-64-598 SS2]EIW74275.1 histone-fold-containing protein [Coniophora puteana RWD-64-598 SS2]
MPRKENANASISAQAQQDLVSDGIQNYELPKSLVTKIAKSAIPDTAKLQKETVLSLVKGSTVFINYLAATAHDVAHSKQHKSISASDVLKALELIEFGDLVEPLQAELQIYRDTVKTDKSRKGASARGANSSTAKTKDSAPLSISLSTKGKGKAAATPASAASTTAKTQVHADQVAASVSGMSISGPNGGASERADEEMDDDVGEEDEELGGYEEEVEPELVGGEDEDPGDEGVDEEDDDGEVEGGETEDAIVLEGEETRRDVKRLEVHADEGEVE